MGITMLISFYTTRITLEVLGVDDYGLNNLVASIVSMFGFINGSMGSAVQRFFSVELGKNKDGNLSRFFGTGLYLHIIVAIITFLIAEIFAIFFLAKLNIPKERIFAAQVVFQISAFSLTASILNVPFAALLRAREEFSKVAVFDIIQALLRLGVLFLLYRIDYDKIISLSTLNFGVSLLYLSGITLLATRFKEAKFKIVRDKKIIKKMLNFISMLLITVLSSVLNKQGIVILVNLFFGLTINAAYAIAFQVSNIMETFSMNFKQSVVPQLMVAYGANDKERMNRLMFIGTKITFLLMMLISIPIIFESDFILKLWLKEPPKYASKFTMLILFSANINTFSYFIYQAVHASGKIKKQQILTSASYLLSVITIYLAFKFGGNFYYAVYIPIIFSIIRNWIIVLCAKGTISLDVKYFMIQVVGRCVVLIVFLGIASALAHSSLDESFTRLLFVVVVNTIFIIIGGYYLLFNKMEKETVIKIILEFTPFFSKKILN